MLNVLLFISLFRLFAITSSVMESVHEYWCVFYLSLLTLGREKVAEFAHSLSHRGGRGIGRLFVATL